MEKNAVITIVAKKTVEFKDLKKKLEFLLKKKIELVDSFSTKILKKKTKIFLLKSFNNLQIKNLKNFLFYVQKIVKALEE